MENYNVYAQEWFKLNQEGLSLREIGKRYGGVSHNTVSRILRKHKLSINAEHLVEFKDISNQKFGLITAIKVSERTEKGSYYWWAYCACNTEVLFEVPGTDLRRGRKTHCGCNFPRKFDISGQTFGYLTAIEDSGIRRNGHVSWKSICICLKITFVNYGDLTNGHTKSCGCKHRKFGEDHPNWTGSTPLKLFLRGKLHKWKSDSFTHYGRNCVITGTGEQIEIHHVNKSFYEIFHETLYFLALPELSEIGKYSSEDSKNLQEKFIELHYKYGLGVPINHKLHKEFHSIYGHSTTMEDLVDFINTKKNK